VSGHHEAQDTRDAGEADVMSGFVDLHAHSTASDGALAPAEVVETAARAGLAALALTDHDTLAGVVAAREAGARFGVRIVAGVELSVVDDGREIHLLGLHIARVDALEAELQSVRAARRTRAQRIVGKLNELGVAMAIEAVWAQAGDGAVGRPHVARALIAGGWARDQRDAFDRYLGAGRPANVEKEPVTISDGVRLIHDCGGLAVIAHPGQDGRRERIEPLVAMGLDGIEVLHPGHGTEDIARLAALADFFSLVPSGGSDWHGATTGPRVLGCMKVPAQWLQRQDACLAARVQPNTATVE
jgi:predicted metal-dependent phosphoesterase TrpH